MRMQRKRLKNEAAQLEFEKPQPKTYPLDVECNIFRGFQWEETFIPFGKHTIHLTCQQAKAFKANEDVRFSLKNCLISVKNWGRFSDKLIVANNPPPGNGFAFTKFSCGLVFTTGKHEFLLTPTEIKRFREDPQTQDLINKKEIEILSWGDCEELPDLSKVAPSPQISTQPLPVQPVEEEILPEVTTTTFSKSTEEDPVPSEKEADIQETLLPKTPDPIILPDYLCDAELDETLTSNLMG